MARIQPLSQEAVSQIHSSKQISSLSGVVLSLLENSLDAGSSKVEITVAFRRGACSIEDNGLGIPSLEFLENGGLGKMYHTSKRTERNLDSELHGSTGTYLASLAALSLVSIASDHANQNETASLVIHQGKVVSRERSLLATQDHGTRVFVRDLFGNMPVRVKQRALDDNDIAYERAWQDLRRGIVALLLPWHRPCSVRLRDELNEKKSMYLSSQHPTISTALTEKNLGHFSGIASKFDLRDNLSLLFQAGMASHESSSKWIPVSASLSNVSVKGVISLEPSPTKHCQFISIGIHPCSPSSGHSDVYDAVNKVFTNSGFGSIDDDVDIDETEKDRRQRDRRYKSGAGYTQKQLHGCKGVDRWPMFVLQVKLSHQITPENVNDASLKAILDVLEATVTQWLETHHFRPRKRRRKRKGEQTRPAASSTGSGQLSPISSPPDSRSTTPGRTTPTFKRSTITESASTTKKRKIVDSYGRSRDMRESRPSTVHGLANYFQSWSRIKSARPDSYDNMWHDSKRPVYSVEQSDLDPTSKTKNITSAFRLPSLEAGALSRDEAQRSGHLVHVPTTPPTIAASESQHQQSLASDDFGSIDSEEMLGTIEAGGRIDRSDVAQAVSYTNFTTTPSDDDQSFEDSTLDWTDLVTKQVFRVNTRTGVVMPWRPKSNVDDTLLEHSCGPAVRQTAAIDTSLSSTGRPFSLSRRPHTVTRQKGTEWLPGFLKEWDNPVFSRVDEEPIPLASFDGPRADANDFQCTNHDRKIIFTGSGASGEGKLSKAGLREANFIRQVDRKFLLCKMSSIGAESTRDSLVLVDQHAASERVILERLLAELCAPADAPPGESAAFLAKTVRLEKPLHFQISTAEHQLFDDHRRRFVDWGINYRLATKIGDISASQVRPAEEEHHIVVEALPLVIAERCTLLPKILIELLRSEIWDIASTARRRNTTITKARDDTTVDNGNNENHFWLKHLGSCPQGILNMLNSRACRSAIMFNDELSINQCEELLTDLSKCAFPFMCAHGRVSMVPLVKLGSGGEGRWMLGESDSDGLRFGDAFKKWTGDQLAGSDTNSS